MINLFKPMDLLKYILISIPMISAMTCGIIFMVIFHKSLSVGKNRIRKTLGGYFILMVILWFLASISVDHYRDNIWGIPLIYLIIPFYFLIIHLLQVVYYHFICLILPIKSRFNYLHYRVSFAIFIMCSSLIFVLINTDGYKELDFISFFHQYLYIYASLSMGYYIILSWIRLYKYNKVNSEVTKISIKLNWLHLLLLTRSVFTLLFIISYNRIIIIDIALVVVNAAQHIIVTFNVLQKDIIYNLRGLYQTNIMLPSGQIVSIDKKGALHQIPIELTQSSENQNAQSLITQQDIITYFSQEKPYLNKDFKLDDLVKHFGVNRTYISKFINVTFNTNVSQYINYWRLQEVEHLLKTTSTADKDQIAIMAGFSNYRHYLRAKESNTKKKQNS